jgi:hypothetical protein
MEIRKQSAPIATTRQMNYDTLVIVLTGDYGLTLRKAQLIANRATRDFYVKRHGVTVRMTDDHEYFIDD